MRRNARLLATVGFAALALAIEIALVLRQLHIQHDFPTVRIVGAAITGLMFVGCGLVAVWRAPHPRMGWLMVAAGFLWMCEDIITIHAGPSQALDYYTGHASDLGLALVVLGFPTGRFTTWPARVVVGLAGVAAVILQPLARIADDRPCAGFDCHWYLNQDVSHTTHEILITTADIATSGAVAGGVAVVAYRWLTGTRPARRMLAPFLGVSLALGLLALPSVMGGPRPLGDLLPLSRALFPIALLAGLVRVRLVRVNVTELAAQLDGAPSLADLRATLARTLGDPSIAVLSAADDDWRDEEDRPVPPPAADARRAVTLVGDPPVGALVHDPALRDDPQLMDAVVGAIGLALRNNALHAEVARQLARAVDATDQERRRVARDLHDGAQQRLAGLRFDVGALRRRLEDLPDPDVHALLASIDDAAAASLTELRRLVHGLAPPTLTEDGLGPAIEELAAAGAVRVIVEDRLDQRLPAPLETAVYLLVSEALANVIKHADAHIARVLLATDGGVLQVDVSDDGRGGADPSRGSGLRGMSDRAAAFGGALQVTSPAGRGTTVSARFPLAPRLATATAG